MAGIDHGAFLDIGGGQRGRIERLAFGLNHHDFLKPVLGGELEVALVVGRYGHDRAGAVVVEHEVGRKDRHLEAGDRIEAVLAGKDALLLVAVGSAGDLVVLQSLGHELVDGGFLFGALGQLLDQRVFGRDAHEGRAEERVGAGGEDLDFLVAIFELEADQRAFAAADPVLLHGQHAFGPAVLELLDVVEQFLGVGRDLEVPLVVLLQDDLAVAAPALAVFDLLVGQHRVAALAPVQKAAAAIDQALLIHLDEEELFPAVVFGVAGGDLAVPVVAQAQALELDLHVLDVLVGPLAGVHVAGDGGVFGRHAEGVEAHGMQHVETLHALVARHDVADGVVAHVAHVDAARGVGEHLQQVVFGLGGVFGDLEKLVALPGLLPPGLKLLRLIFHL
ncbi:MAG: hypothetical protein BWY87_00937 [Deltaproteobacteria bacterium ADurb.Bin510]|nr:MAG: hypothetical protein BWY87_00937 [Deltaproteobacteria bacterium ADurb.Bin510]